MLMKLSMLRSKLMVTMMQKAGRVNLVNTRAR